MTWQCLGSSHQDGSDDQISGAQGDLEVVSRAVEGLHATLEGVVEPTESVERDVEDGDVCTHAHRHAHGIESDDAAADDDNLSRGDTRDATEENAAAAAHALEAASTGLDTQSASNLGHWSQQGKGAVRILNRLVGYAHHATVQQGIGLGAVGGEVQVGVEDLPLAHARVPGAMGSLTFQIMPARVQTSSAVETISAPAAMYSASGMPEPAPALCSTITL